MKRITKGTEPDEFSRWKEQDKMAHRPNWNRVPPRTKHRVHESLIQEQGFICCYCESSINMKTSHVEHFRPVAKFGNEQLNYNNLHCSCQRELSAGEPHHCGYLKSSWFDEELLVSPMSPSCETRFGFTGNGDIFPRCQTDDGAKTTIRKLGLDLPKLRALRAAAVDELYDLAKDDIRQIMKRQVNGKFQQFHTTITQVLLA